ncbi:hypothetical protein D3C87_1774310 [compost metagenome]
MSDAPPRGTSISLTLTTPTAPEAHLVKVSADGTVGPLLKLPLSDFCIDANQNVWAAGGTSVTKLSPEGTPLLTLPLTARFVTSDEADIYIGDGARISKLVP